MQTQKSCDSRVYFLIVDLSFDNIENKGARNIVH
jgi:hypothetical protein